MDNIEAIKSLIDGKKITHIDWSNTEYMELKDGVLLEETGKELDFTYIFQHLGSDFSEYSEDVGAVICRIIAGQRYITKDSTVIIHYDATKEENPLRFGEFPLRDFSNFREWEPIPDDD